MVHLLQQGDQPQEWFKSQALAVVPHKTVAQVSKIGNL
jgi:hypothetical protein